MLEKIRKRMEILRNLMTIFALLTELDTHEDLIITSRIKAYTNVQAVLEKHDDFRSNLLYNSTIESNSCFK